MIIKFNVRKSGMSSNVLNIKADVTNTRDFYTVHKQIEDCMVALYENLCLEESEKSAVHSSMDYSEPQGEYMEDVAPIKRERKTGIKNELFRALTTPSDDEDCEDYEDDVENLVFKRGAEAVSMESQAAQSQYSVNLNSSN